MSGMYKSCALPAELMIDWTFGPEGGDRCSVRHSVERQGEGPRTIVILIILRESTKLCNNLALPMLRPKKINCLFPVTTRKKIG